MADTTKAGGYPSVFRGKVKSTRVQGIMTPTGRACFDDARARLAALYREVTGEKPPTISDGDTIEYLARGEKATRAILKRK